MVYRTKQQEAIFCYVQAHPGVHLTVQMIYDYFFARQEKIGLTTIYRHMEKLVEEGTVVKYAAEGMDSACYEYAPHHVEETCFHCKCESCGTLIHLHCDELKEIGRHLQAEHGFVLNPLRTIFYGLCPDCAKNNRCSLKRKHTAKFGRKTEEL